MPKHNLVKDPEALAALLARKRPGPELKLALGLDLGTTTGYSYAWFDPGEPWLPARRPVHCGQLDLSLGDYDSGAIRFIRLQQFLTALDPDIVFFEDVHGAVNTGSFGPRPTVVQIVNRVARTIELFGSFKNIVAVWCEERDIPCQGFPLATVKKRATGLGNANKEAVIRAANEEFAAGLAVEDYDKLGTDNVADSLYVLVLGLEQYSRGVAPSDGYPPKPKAKKGKS